MTKMPCLTAQLLTGLAIVNDENADVVALDHCIRIRPAHPYSDQDRSAVDALLEAGWYPVAGGFWYEHLV